MIILVLVSVTVRLNDHKDHMVFTLPLKIHKSHMIVMRTDVLATPRTDEPLEMKGASLS